MKSNNAPLQIGITGGIGSGKSLASKIFYALGVPVYDADTRARWVMQYNPVLIQDIITAFGTSAYNADTQQLNRSYLAAQVFNNAEKVALLNSIVHPRVAEDYADWVQAHSKYPYLLKEAALLYEAGSYQFLDKIITVSAPITVRIERIRNRDPHRTLTDIQAIMDKQLSEEEKLQRADFILYNDESRLLIPQILALHEQFLAMAGKTY
ncbi:dephospho-CoA kinase [Rhodocytophaga rosea]|uniref:Dephospho-CoA kinase n=1 Tax=Rhodocytophaga rosea TaxID=2704465 RepID=A0A6C0GQE5_9BACT|nr:dephospho-CoA kinase [Rhodocytophaga rosea]QHT69833.1 dephospho-CoA kinase [Rhodocytophaga rosea]